MNTTIAILKDLFLLIDSFQEKILIRPKIRKGILTVIAQKIPASSSQISGMKMKPINMVLICTTMHFGGNPMKLLRVFGNAYPKMT